MSSSSKPRTVDLRYAIHAIGRLSHTTLLHLTPEMGSENILLHCIESSSLASSLRPEITTETGRILFEIGVVAIEKKQDLVAVTALNNLLALVQANQPARGELVADALGLTAHFWVAGPTAQKFVENKLQQLRGELAFNLHDELESAHKHCMQTMFFQTADHLTKMIQDLYNPQK